MDILHKSSQRSAIRIDTIETGGHLPPLTMSIFSGGGSVTIYMSAHELSAFIKLADAVLDRHCREEQNKRIQETNRLAQANELE